MPSFNYLLRSSAKDGESMCRLCLRIIHCRKVKQLTIPYKLYPDEWDKHKQCVVYPKQEHPRYGYLSYVEQYLLELKSKFITIVEQLECEGEYDIRDLINHCREIEKKNTLSNFTDKLVYQLNASSQYRTARAYRTACRALMHFNDNREITLDKIDNKLILSFERSLKAKGRCLNTISFYMRNLRAIYNKALNERLILPKDENPFACVFTGIQKTRKRSLTTEEMAKLNKLNFNHPAKEERLHRAWRLFFFSFHARGMSFVDLAYLRKENIQEGIIRYYRKKTGNLVEVKITNVMQQIIDSFADETSESDYLFPILTDQNKPLRLQYETGLRRQNICLKQMAAKVNITKPLSTHVARHSWATIAKRENLPLWAISEGLGHCNEKTTYIYLDSLDRSTLDGVSDIICAALDRYGTPAIAVSL